MKKLFGIFMAAVTVIAACVGFVGCNKKPAGTIYSLQEAYDNGLLTKEDLEQIAYYNNNFVKPEEELDAKIEQKIKKSLAYKMRHGSSQVTDATADGFRISKYYGEYNGCYAFIEMNHYESLPAVEVETTIGGVSFTFPNPSGIKVYKNK